MIWLHFLTSWTTFHFGALFFEIVVLEDRGKLFFSRGLVELFRIAGGN
jgi:hypothetical protein